MGGPALDSMMSMRCFIVSLAVFAVIGGSAHQFQDTFEENDVVVPETDGEVLLQDEFLSRFNRGRGTLPESEFVEDEYGSHEETDGSKISRAYDDYVMVEVAHGSAGSGYQPSASYMPSASYIPSAPYQPSALYMPSASYMPSYQPSASYMPSYQPSASYMAMAGRRHRHNHVVMSEAAHGSAAGSGRHNHVVMSEAAHGSAAGSGSYGSRVVHFG